MRVLTLTLALAAFTLAACGGGDADTTTTTAPTPAPAAPAAPAPEPAAAPVAPYEGPAAEVTLTPVGNEMKYEQTEFEVYPGQEVRLTFNNTATNPAMSHNVVVLRSQADVNPVGQAAMSAADTDYIPASQQSRILAHTPMAAPGSTVEVTFTAPAELGDFPYICTFPGHYMMMQGTMRVVQAPA